MITPKRTQKGFSSILAVIFVTLFSVLAIAFTALSNMNVQISRNHRDVIQAQAAAESGLSFMQYVVADYILTEAEKTFDPNVTNDDATQTYDDFIDYVQVLMNGSTLLAGKTIAAPVTFTEAGQTGWVTTIPEIPYASDAGCTFTIEMRQYDDNPKVVVIRSIGASADINRTVRIDYNMVKDTKVLKFSVASRGPVKITDDTLVDVGLYSDWKYPGVAPPITLAGVSSLKGDVNTTLSPSDFTDAGYDLADLMLGTYDEINYDQPQLDLPTAADFDTSSYAKSTTVINAGLKSGKVDEFYPHAPGNYTQPLNFGSVQLNRTIYENLVIKDRQAIAGNAVFRNCTFEGIFYIGTSGDGLGTNNMRFENCTFNGPIITNVPTKMGPEDWKKNLLYFTGDTTFNNSVLAETTILAPNYNVDIGNAVSGSVLSGIVLGGVVDIRGDALVDGSIISMADPEEIGLDLAAMLDTTVGISDNGGHTIKVLPKPNNQFPIGMASKIILEREGDSFVEL